MVIVIDGYTLKLGKACRSNCSVLNNKTANSSCNIFWLERYCYLPSPKDEDEQPRLSTCPLISVKNPFFLLFHRVETHILYWDKKHWHSCARRWRCDTICFHNSFPHEAGCKAVWILKGSLAWEADCDPWPSRLFCGHAAKVCHSWPLPDFLI